MEVRQLAALVAIADHGTFSAAARSLFTVQSNVSGHVAKLERELGVTLVDRSAGQLTDEGHRVVDRARRILHELDDISADVASNEHEVSGGARIGTIGSTARWLMPQVLRSMADRHPRVHPVLMEGSTSALVPNLLTGHLNAAIVHLPVDDPELVIDPLFAEELALIAPSDHPVTSLPDVTIEDLDDQPLFLPPPGAAMRRVLDRAAAAAGISLRAQAEIDGVRLLASLALDGHGAAIVPATAIPRRTDPDVVVRPVPGLPRRVVAWARPHRPPPSAATRAFEVVARAIVAQEADRQRGISIDPDVVRAATR